MVKILVNGSEMIENDRNTAILYPIFKKGNLTITENYRGIYLLDTTNKKLYRYIQLDGKVYLRDNW